ncbi:hypothetical protein K7X08_028168 [Anisodus acutangulus]|uniref:Cytochrome P450 n=1 Tax=Anisodus acutangulus TaxID=402998 RepID=A0A9Q1RR34_9SOLA|nr:hypothetical protein K7X08_028168 [Anisodus acutangulus]
MLHQEAAPTITQQNPASSKPTSITNHQSFASSWFCVAPVLSEISIALWSSYVDSCWCINFICCVQRRHSKRNLDINFAARPEFGSSEYQIYHDTMFSILDYNKLWIFLKKICMTEILSAQQICEFADVRKEEMMKLLEVSLSMSTRTSTNVNESAEIREIAKGIVLLAGQLGLGEVFGPSKKYDLLGAGEKVKTLLLKFDMFMDEIIKKHEDQKLAGRKYRKDMMDILLEIADDENAEIKLTRSCIKGLSLDLFVGGSDTTSVGLQWGLAELLNHPKVLKKLQEEIERVVGLERLVEDSDIPNLPYLDLNEWTDADEFIPERYLVNSDENLAIEPDELEAMRGQNFCYVPFGGGRRGCPGAGLAAAAAAVLHRTLGVLIQCFDWKIKGAHKLNMEQGAGLSSTMVHPLVCHPVMRVNPQEIATPAY